MKLYKRNEVKKRKKRPFFNKKNASLLH